MFHMEGLVSTHLISRGVVQSLKELRYRSVRAHVHPESGRHALGGERDGGEASCTYWIVVL